MRLQLDIIRKWSAQDRQNLRDAVPRDALAATINGQSVHDIAREVVAISTQGLANRNRKNGAGETETKFLDPIAEIAETGMTVADKLLAQYHGAWNGDITQVFNAARF